MADSMARGRLLSVRQLEVDHCDRDRGVLRPLLKGVDLDLHPGQALALVGPSGCGKSLTARALLGLLAPDFAWRGEICWRGTRLTNPRGETWRQVRGRGLGLIMQEPLANLNPVLRVGDQIAESFRVHHGVSWADARRRAVALLAETRVPVPAFAADRYPHQLSGGMRQRVLLAAVLACDPALLIADEPTTALDMSVQQEILVLINRIRQERNMAFLFITHDLNLVPLLTDRVAFMTDGRIAEATSIAQVDLPPAPDVNAVRAHEVAPVLKARDLVVRYEGAQNAAVAGVDLTLRPGQAIGLLGESGCGKTSLGRALARHLPLERGSLQLIGDESTLTGGARERERRRRVQMLFQDPGSSLDPRQRVAAALREAAEPATPAPAQLLYEVGLDSAVGSRYPHQLSGGQRQRVALARCLAVTPLVLIADEPTSALDVAARDLVLALLTHIMRERGLAVLLISHDLEVLRGACQEVQVMYGGLIVEILPGGETFGPRHPHTLALQAALPRTLRQDPGLWAEKSARPHDENGANVTGCPLYGDCPLQKPLCGKELPPLLRLSVGHWLRCPEAEAAGPSHFIDT